MLDFCVMVLLLVGVCFGMDQFQATIWVEMIVSFNLANESVHCDAISAFLSHSTCVKLSVYDDKHVIISNSWCVSSQYSRAFLG